MSEIRKPAGAVIWRMRIINAMFCQTGITEKKRERYDNAGGVTRRFTDRSERYTIRIKDTGILKEYHRDICAIAHRAPVC